MVTDSAAPVAEVGNSKRHFMYLERTSGTSEKEEKVSFNRGSAAWNPGEDDDDRAKSTFKLDLMRMITRTGARSSTLAEEVAALDKSGKGTISEEDLLEYLRKKNKDAITMRYLSSTVALLVVFVILLVGLNGVLTWYITDLAKDTGVDSNTGVLRVRNSGSLEDQAVNVGIDPLNNKTHYSILSSLMTSMELDSVQFIDLKKVAPTANRNATDVTIEPDMMDAQISYEGKLPVESWFRLSGFGDSGTLVVFVFTSRRGFAVLDGFSVVGIGTGDFPDIELSSVMDAIDAVDIPEDDRMDALNAFLGMLEDLDRALLPTYLPEDVKEAAFLDHNNRVFTHQWDLEPIDETQRHLLTWRQRRRRYSYVEINVWTAAACTHDAGNWAGWVNSKKGSYNDGFFHDAQDGVGRKMLGAEEPSPKRRLLAERTVTPYNRRLLQASQCADGRWNHHKCVAQDQLTFNQYWGSDQVYQQMEYMGIIDDYNAPSFQGGYATITASTAQQFPPAVRQAWLDACTHEGENYRGCQRTCYWRFMVSEQTKYRWTGGKR